MNRPLVLLTAGTLAASATCVVFWQRTQDLREALANAERLQIETAARLATAESERAVARTRAAALDDDLTVQRARATEAEARAAQFSRDLAEARNQASLAREEGGRHEAAAQGLRQELADLKLSLPPFTTADVVALQDRVAELEHEVEQLTPATPATAAAGPLPAGSPVRILQVGPADAFVVLAYGSDDGARLSQSLPVRRGTETIATVHILELQPRLSLATVAPETLRSGLRQGDTAFIASLP